MSIITNFLRHWTAAEPQHRREGRDWYGNARILVAKLASEHHTTKPVVAGVLAATSPRMHWSRNVAVTRLLLGGHAVTGVFRHSLDKARRIIAGAKPLGVLGGNKVRAFYRALLGDRSAAVIDVWMLRAAGMDPETRLTDAAYARITRALQAVAAQLRIAVADLQATIWVVVRGRAS